MAQVSEICRNNPTLLRVAGGVVVVTAGLYVCRRLLKRNAREKKVYPLNTVILHQIGRGPYAPSMTPFAVKLETYLRMARIPYQNEHDSRKSSKGKVPWIEYNGQSVADSAFCITYLNQVYGIDFHAKLTPVQALVLQKWVHELDVGFIMSSRSLPLAPLYIRYKISPMIKRYAWCQGMGRHSREEVLDIARKDLTAIADYMGEKKFLMGDEPCETDCTVFGMLSQLYWHSPTQRIGKIFREEFPSLVAYCDRMKKTFWPDWDQCITHGGTREATS
ncbi:hypothetical protein BaRGS_00039343 [Batillaria attramentaria]|uniref:Uncharacterized protein n=1 Tax=Batillaria attramentaria TaxID=370345 RepID=A0ABD0J3J6_9CAEN